MITTKQIGLAASLVLASNFAVAGMGNTYNVDDLSTVNGEVVTYSATLTTDRGYFTDTFNFTVSDSSPLWDFSALFQSPWEEMEFSDISLNSGQIGSVVDFMDAGVRVSQAELSAVLAPGTYSLYVSGMGNSMGKDYTVDTMLSPVPEPSSIALMLGGLGLVGFMAARRRKNA